MNYGNNTLKKKYRIYKVGTFFWKKAKKGLTGMYEVGILIIDNPPDLLPIFYVNNP